jgi:hypothetical protein
LKHGKAKYVYANGASYSGDWIRGMREGKGKFVGKDGAIYEGDWMQGLKHGIGKKIFVSGDTFEGEYRKGVQFYGIYKWRHNSASYLGPYDTDGDLPCGTKVQFVGGNTLEIMKKMNGKKQRLWTNKEGNKHVQTYEFGDEIILGDYSLITNTQSAS